MKPKIIGLVVATAVAALLIPALSADAVPRDCGPTTLQGTIVFNPETGLLECGPGESVVVRDELANPQSGREGRRVPMKAIFTFADFQLADEESPVRGEWLDGCEGSPGKSAFRPHETMVPHMMNAHFRAANRIAETGSPVLKAPFDFAVALGDNIDNQQYNEVRWFIDLLDGGKLVDPDSGDKDQGGDGYDGVQAVDPSGKTPLPFPIPEAQRVTRKTDNLRNLANEPFWATGLRNPDGSHLRWYSVMGNHDMKIQGTIPDDDPVWRTFVRGRAVGNLKVMALSGEMQNQACQGQSDPAFWMAALTQSPQSVVPPDPDRRLLDRADWIAEHSNTTGIPKGHGFEPEERMCPPQPDKPTIPASILRRACYYWIEEPFHFITLDTTASEGLENGNIDPIQWAWLEEQLKSSSTYYFEADGARVDNPAGKDRLIVIFSHHPHERLVNPGYPWNHAAGTPPFVEGDVRLGQDLVNLLLRFPNVILNADGHTHKNKIWAHQDQEKGTGYWEVNTSAIADYPTHSRTIEITDNLDGTISIFAVIFDMAVDPNVRTGSGIDWFQDDPTDEVALSGGAVQIRINEDWLASAGREILFNDLQQEFDKIGDREDRNVELLLGTPFALPTGGHPDMLAATGSPRLRLSTLLGALAALASIALMAAAARRRDSQNLERGIGVSGYRPPGEGRG